jgi:hypothetical protein
MSVAAARASLSPVILRYDDTLLVTPHVYGQPASANPVLHLKWASTGGCFDDYARSFDAVRADARPWTPEQEDSHGQYRPPGRPDPRHGRRGPHRSSVEHGRAVAAGCGTDRTVGAVPRPRALSTTWGRSSASAPYARTSRSDAGKLRAGVLSGHDASGAAAGSDGGVDQEPQRAIRGLEGRPAAPGTPRDKAPPSGPAARRPGDGDSAAFPHGVRRRSLWRALVAAGPGTLGCSCSLRLSHLADHRVLAPVAASGVGWAERLGRVRMVRRAGTAGILGEGGNGEAASVGGGAVHRCCGVGLRSRGQALLGARGVDSRGPCRSGLRGVRGDSGGGFGTCPGPPRPAASAAVTGRTTRIRVVCSSRETGARLPREGVTRAGAMGRRLGPRGAGGGCRCVLSRRAPGAAVGVRWWYGGPLRGGAGWRSPAPAPPPPAGTR